MYRLHFFILFVLKGPNRMFHNKISPEADKIGPFSSDLYPYTQVDFLLQNVEPGFWALSLGSDSVG